MRVLFVCRGNSARSQMAEGWCKHLHGQRLQAVSAYSAAQCASVGGDGDGRGWR